ncbi:hypothetical protein AAFF_G00159710 [Aldrovandia affinis]|uniref:Ferric-chelate reductase 1 n=1 Tax=Aldrovandia affinis TaxID=143900 RepID=A0AAD7RMY9_9TELE|nr:hypothetical protein AAFF_G00159710 [Aldrovandia affinis]
MSTNGAVLKIHMYALLSIVCVIRVAGCYSSGEVPQSCTDMTPRHTGASAQPTTSPYSIIPDRNRYSGGDEITVTLQAGPTAFIGFMLQAREVGGSGPIGSFTVTDVQARLLSCNDVLNSTITHKSNTPKTKLQGLWRAPASGNVKDIEFRATFVKNFLTYWLQVKSSRVLYSAQPNPNVTSVFNTTTIRPPNSMAISSAGCGSNKVCLSRPSGCDPSSEADCYFMAALTSPTDSAIRFEMSGPLDGYIAIGFSDDRLMGNDDIYICGLDRNSALQVQHAYSTGRRAPEILTLGNISDIRTSFLDGVISCSFTSRNPVTIQRSAAISSLYYLMFAYGPTNNGRIQFHTNTFISEKEVDLLWPQSRLNHPDIVKAHGALMLIAWMTNRWMI